MSSDDEVYEVSHIVDEDHSNPNTRMFLVRWMGYPPEFDSWEPLENLHDGAMDVIREWDRKQKLERKRKAREEKEEKVRAKKKPKRNVTQAGNADSPVRVNVSQTELKFPSAMSASSFERKESVPQSRLTQLLYPKFPSQPFIMESKREVKKSPVSHNHVPAGTPLVKTITASANRVVNGQHGNAIDLVDDPVIEEEIGDRQHRKRRYPAHLYTEFIAILDSISGAPVWVVNEIDSEPSPPLVFKWIEEYLHGPGVPIRDDQFSVGCSCPGDECDLNDPKACECLEDLEEKKFAYDANGLIHHPPGTAIFECNNRCGCGRSCPNRVVQRGRRMPLEIFKTHKKGWGLVLGKDHLMLGVRTIRSIPKGMFISRYIGEVITEAEAERRGQEYDRKGITYLFDLDFFHPNNDSTSIAGSPEPEGNLFCVDAMHYGNVSRFFNHSCNPNIAIYTVVRNGDNRVYDLAMFAIRNIKPFEELCFDYKTKKGVKLKQPCYCGDKSCRGWLFGN